MNTVIKKAWEFVQSETFRYLVFGVLTVVVNIASFKVLSVFLGQMAANTLAFFISVLFAYWTNSTFVFRVPYTWKSFMQFVGMRIGTLPIDVGGMWLLLAAGVNDMVAKCLVCVVIIVINYVVSKWIVFRKKEASGRRSKA